jgi:two-component system, OmpR family, response regulator
MRRILMIDDDALLAAPLATYFKRFDYELDSATSPSAGLAKLRARPYDAAILDVMLPEMDGFELCRTIRRESDIPIVMLTARGDVMDRIVGLEIGADDYLPKPFHLAELVARIRALSRRSRAVRPPTLVYADLELDSARRTVSRAGRPLSLSPKEFSVLELLLGAEGDVVSTEQILEHAWDDATDPFTNAVRMTISRLRAKLGDPPVIATVTPVGYRIGEPS